MNAFSRNRFSAAAVIAALVTAVIAAPRTWAAGQAATTETSSVNVTVGDLDAHTAGGAQHIYYRLQRAAEQVCGDDETHLQLELTTLVRHCEQQAIEPAVDLIHTAPLTAIYSHHFPERRGTVAVEPEARG